MFKAAEQKKGKKKNCGKVLTEILPDVQQDLRRSSVELIKKRAEAEYEQCTHAETISSQGDTERRRGEEPVALSAVSLSDVVGSVAVAVKGTAAVILHHLLLTKRLQKSPIRLWEVALESFKSKGIQRSPPLLCFFTHTVSPSLLPSSDDCASRPSSQRS